MSAVGVAAGVLIWQIGSVVVHDNVLLPSPAETVRTWWYYLHHPYPALGEPLWMHALDSTVRILIGWGAGTAIGLALGALMAGFRPARHFFDPFIEATRPLPPLAFIPVLIVWFGIGNLPKVVLIMMGVIPIMTVSTVAALDRVPEDMVHASRCLGASRLYSMVHVRLRSALPHLVTGMRLGMGISWGSIVAAEMIVATNGLGYVILQASEYLNTSLIFAGILCIAILGIGFDLVFRAVLRLLDPTLSR